MTQNPKPTLLQSLIPIVFLIVMLSINVGLFGTYALDGSNQVILILAGGVTAVVGIYIGYTWTDVEKGIVKTISSAMPSILILFVIGALAGTWMLSGIVPAMIYYGLKILNPTIFLCAACIICSVVSIATGSSWTTAATVGIALIGIGGTLGIPVGWVAGAILSGAYFGDKMSPLSDTTNLAPAMAGTDLFTHIRYMSITTVPTISISLLVFLVYGLANGADGTIAEKADILAAIGNTFHISGWLFIVPGTVIFMIVRKVPAVPALLIGAMLGAVFALIFQPDLVRQVGSEVGADGKLLGPMSSASNFQLYFLGTMQSLFGDIHFDTGMTSLDEAGLLGASGMAGIVGTVWLIIAAMVFGGAMEGTNMLKRIASAILTLVKSNGSLISSTAGTCLFFNLTASDQYLAIVVPGRMYADVYKEKGLAPENLSRTLEDSGTVTSVLVPWNTCGAYHATVLGVATMTYLPYCIFNLVSPLMTIFIGYLGYKIRPLALKKK